MRQHRRPVTGRMLADAVGVSIRTLYRDIASLQAMGAGIEGEAGIGYVLKPGFLLPPLMFTPEEIEALALGSRWVANRADDRLRDAARSALTRIAAILPADLRDELDGSTLLIGPGLRIPVDAVDPTLLRKAIRVERKLAIRYRDAAGSVSERIVWPFALAFFDAARLLLGWCEWRQGFRHFRTDHILSATPMEARYPRRRQVLMKEWRETEGITKRLD